MLNSLCLPQLGDEVFNLTRSDERIYFSLSFPAVYIAAPEHCIRFVLADHFRFVALLLELAYYFGCHIADECGVGHGLIGEIEGKHDAVSLGVLTKLFERDTQERPREGDEHQARDIAEERGDVSHSDVAYYAGDNAEEQHGGDNQLNE